MNSKNQNRMVHAIVKVGLLTCVLTILWKCQSHHFIFKTRDQYTVSRIVGGGVKYFYKKEIDDLTQQCNQILGHHFASWLLLNEVIVKKYQRDNIGLFILSPDASVHSTSHYAKVLKFADTTIVNFNGYAQAKNILPPSHMLGAMRYFKQLYKSRFTNEELEEIENSFYKGVIKRQKFRR